MTLEIKSKINPEYEKLYPPLTVKEKQDLEKSIIQYKGNHTAIVVDQHGFIVEGHHRFRLCGKHGFEPKIEVREFANEVQVLKFIKSCNHDRRHLNDFLKAKVALNFKQAYEKKAKENMSKGGKGVSIETPLGRVNKQLAEEFRTTATNIHRAETILEKGSPQVINKLECGQSNISKEYKLIIKQEEIQNAQTEALRKREERAASKPYELHLGDLRKVLFEFEPNSVDCVISDVPYRREDLPLVPYWASGTYRTLKPGGSAFFIVGHPYIFEINDLIRANSGLKFHWPLAILHELNNDQKRAHSVRAHGWAVWPHYKPMYWYFKPKGDAKKPTMYKDMTNDVIQSKHPDKTLHPDAQSVEEAKHVLDVVTMPGHVVLDCCMGKGTFGEAAIEMGLHFIGIEIDSRRFNIADNLLNDTQFRLEQ